MTVQIQDIQPIENAMRGLMAELSKLAPHPDHPDHTGPHFVQIDSQYTPAAEYDGMLGSMMLEGMLGTSFAGASGGMDWGQLADMAGEALKDRTPQSGSPSYQLGQRGSISGGFNRASKRDALMKAYKADLPQRLALEAHLAQYQRKIYALRKNAPMPAPARVPALAA